MRSSFSSMGSASTPEKEHGGGGVDAVHGEAGEVIAHQHLPVQLPAAHQGGGGVHHAAVDEDGGQCAEDAQGGAAAAEPALAEQDAGQEADDAHGKHLPRASRAPERTGQLEASMVMAPTRKPVSPPKATPEMMVRAMHRLELGQHEEGSPSRHADERRARR